MSLQCTDCLFDLTAFTSSAVGGVQWVKSGVTLGYDRGVVGYSRYSVTGAEGEGEFNFHIANVR